MTLISEEFFTSAAKKLKEVVVGIDLGTTFSLAAYVDGNQPKVIHNEDGEALVPSVVSFKEDGNVIVGQEARARSLIDPEHTIYSVKRLIGRGQEELAKELGFLPYQVEDAERKLVRIKIRDNQLTPQEVSASILKEIKKRVEQSLKRTISKAVITVPAYFDDTQRQATRDAGRIAGLDILRIINEPTAASLAYGLGNKKKGIIAVYDLGGGTFDISILRIANGVFQVLSTLGETLLGGDDFDRRLMDLAIEDIQKDHGIDINQNPKLLQAIRKAAESSKMELSEKDFTHLTLQSDDPAIDYSRKISKNEFEALISELVQQTIDCCETAIHEAHIDIQKVDEVVLVGGSTRIPLIQNRVETFFGRKPHTELNPDEIVALGAAIQAQILSGGFQEMMVLDVTPLSLGIETIGGATSKLIMRNSAIPCHASERFTTFVDDQTSVDIQVLQGERELAKDCRSLGKWKLRDIPPMPAGVPKITVTFTLDANGVLTVNASEETSGQNLKIEVTPSSGLTDDEVERMVRESVALAREDMLARQIIELHNEIDHICRHTEKALMQAGTQCSPDLATAVKAGKEELLAMLKVTDIHEVQKAIDEFEEISRPLAQIVLDTAAQSVMKDKKINDF